jgi:hypothetical protein
MSTETGLRIYKVVTIDQNIGCTILFYRVRRGAAFLFLPLPHHLDKLHSILAFVSLS